MHTAESHARWGIVLAGGEGTRMRPVISNWLGLDRPKQYCAFVGSRSMFQHTIDRARSVVPDKQIVTIIGRGHRRFLTESMNELMHGVILEQPSNLGTAPGIFLPTAYALADNPEATVILLPSDHFVHPEDRFCDHINHAFELAESFEDRIFLVGAVPDRPETDYGWITQGRTRIDGRSSSIHGPLHVVRFQEKPNRKAARSLLKRGCLWNTMVIAAKAKTLWSLGRQLLPDMVCRFHAFLLVLRAVREGRLDREHEAIALARLYAELAPADFSKDILQHVPNQSMVLPMSDVDWCDWGRPQRVTETLARLGRRPLFSADRFNNALNSATF